MKNKERWMGFLIAGIVVVLAVLIYIIPNIFQQAPQQAQSQSWCERGQAVQYRGIVKPSELTNFTTVMKVGYHEEWFCWIKGDRAEGEYYVNQNNTRALRLERNESAKSFKLVLLR